MARSAILARGYRDDWDLLIASAARTHDVPLVTRNARDFERVPGLNVVSY